MNDTIFGLNWTPTSQDRTYIEQIDRHRFLVEQILLPPRHEAWFRRQVSARRSSGTTRIEGARLGEREVEALVKRGLSGKPTEDERANLNAIRAYEMVDHFSDQMDLPVDEFIIRQVNREFIYRASELLTPGVYRKGENTVGPFSPPNQGDVPALMRAFSEWLRRPDQQIHPIARAAIAHIHLVAIHPFWDGNGRTARALATLLLQRHGYGFRKLLSLDMFLFNTRDQYLDAIERTLGRTFRSEYDCTPWVSFFLFALATHTLQLVGTLTDWHHAMEPVYRLLYAAEVNHRQADGLLYVYRTGQLTRGDYMDIAHTSAVTASRDLAYLVRMGFLAAEGKTRARVYRPGRVSAGSGLPPEQMRLPDGSNGGVGAGPTADP